ncbi:uncharacterized protein METZ01_LOCUS495494, partial [marine metagenome]
SPRISDLSYLIASTIGKVELETVEEGLETKIIGDIVDRAISNVFAKYTEPDEFDFLLAKFEEGLTVLSGSSISDDEYLETIKDCGILEDKLISLCNPMADSSAIISALEFILEGLYLGSKLSKDSHNSTVKYSI